MTGQQRPRSQKARAAASVMETNNSSIVSKRSVERLYCEEPHFYRYFVKKPHRRSPLINRGYFLRMHAIDQVIKQFLDENSKKNKIVLNLGCGYDPIPFQWLSKHPERCNGVTFVDVDFPDLIEKKCDVISDTPLQNLLGHHVRLLDPSGLIMRSERYLAIGCDLADISRLDTLLASEFQLSNCLVLCIAEVSITYMDTKAADSIIQWAGSHDDMRFCLLEQYLPDGAEHPFALKMIRHFNNLQTPLRSIHQYPQLVDQERRFLRARWSSVYIRSMWDLWSDDLFMPPDRRLALNYVEPFDEWEEFVLFASHYFVLLAANTSSPTESTPLYLGHSLVPNLSTFTSWSAEIPSALHCEAFPTSYMRRFGALTPFSPDAFGYHGGLGSKTRLSKTNVYMLPRIDPSDCVNIAAIEEKRNQLESIESRMCHTITSDHLGFLVAGGRASPDRAFRDCWLSDKNTWQRVEDLPIPLFRHCAIAVALEDAAHASDSASLIYGGKTGAGNVSNLWLIWRRGFGWITIPVTGDFLEPRFGAVMQGTGLRRGILLGGMTRDGKILSDAYEWTISGDPMALSLSLNRMKFSQSKSDTFPGRFGSSLVKSRFGLLLVGGVSSSLIPQSFEVIKLFRDDEQKSIWKWAPVGIRTLGQRSLLIGHSTFASSDVVAILGGGGVCFSFGTYWNETIISLSDCVESSRPLKEVLAQEPDPLKKLGSSNNALKSAYLANTVPRDEEVQSSVDFETILNNRQPVIMKNLDLGLCTAEWTLTNLASKIGEDRLVVVHEATNEYMDFQLKNFKYAKKRFGDFADEITRGSPQYLRSLSSENSAGKPADISVDFPELASSFELPPQLEIVKSQMHSSVLRVSGPVTMWLHYDVMANVLCQIHGTKRLILYPPSDISLFSIPPGTSSSSINCFDIGPDRHPSLSLSHPQEALIQAGEVLFIPPLWLHTASPVDKISISVNVFFRNLEDGYAPGRDIYGNRDLQAYEKGRRDIVMMSKSFEKLPTDMAKFYLERLADELRAKAQGYGR